MTAFNVVRFRVKPGRDADFLDAHRKFDVAPLGARKGHILKTGERAYAIIVEWDDIADIVAARAKMIANLDAFRDTLEDLGGGLGVTDPISGPVVLELG